MSLTPNVIWAQRKETVYLKIDLQDVQNQKIELGEDDSSFSFSATSNSKPYALNFRFFGKVSKKESKISVTGRAVELQIKKAQSGFWDHLLAADSPSKKPFWLKVDWNKWKDNDDDDEEAAPGGNDFNLEDPSDWMDNENDNEPGDDDLPPLENEHESEAHDHDHDHAHHSHDHSHGHDHGHDHAHDHGHDHDHDHDHAHDHDHVSHDAQAHDQAHDHSHDHAHDHSHDHAHDQAHDHVSHDAHAHDQAHDHAHDQAHDHVSHDAHDHEHQASDPKPE